MKTYWDLTEEERGRLGAEAVEQYIPIELMEKGCLRPEPPLIEVVMEPILETKMFYRVTYDTPEYSWRQGFDVLFESPGDVDLFRDLVAGLRTTSSGQEVAIPVREMRAESMELPTYDSVLKNREQLARYKTTKERNDRLQREYETASKTAKEACEGLWEDWHRCRELVDKINHILRTWAEYKELAGDEIKAYRFLMKVFTATEIQVAGIGIPDGYYPDPRQVPSKIVKVMDEDVPL